MEVEVADSLASRRRVEANTGFRWLSPFLFSRKGTYVYWKLWSCQIMCYVMYSKFWKRLGKSWKVWNFWGKISKILEKEANCDVGRGILSKKHHGDVSFFKVRESLLYYLWSTRKPARRQWKSGSNVYRHIRLMNHQETHQTNPVPSSTSQYSLVLPSTV